jgi:predicted HTH domain antitoxin
MSKTMSIRMDRDNYEFLSEITKEERSDLSKAVRELVTRGRILLAVERYKKGEASLGKAAELAGLPLGQMMTILTEFGVESRLEKEDYLQGLQNLQKVWSR